ncbi:MAG: hypothetical protein IPK32_23310 [Verrucomicrobiaceae bacterium]|nr:hypothetical protein [Verrucomicrobiaceae bacterium]
MLLAYVGSAKSFIAFNKKEEARNTLQEAKNRKDFQELPEMKEIDKLLSTL